MTIFDSDLPPLNCGGCTKCCEGDRIAIHPEQGDRASNYLTVEENGVRYLKRDENGDCIYLKQGSGCTVHAIAPSSCRMFDCRGYARYVASMSRNERRLRLKHERNRRVYEEGLARLAAISPKAAASGS